MQMNSPKLIAATAMLMGVAVAGAASAQEQAFPTERSQPATCAEVKWNADMLRRHPTMINACREVVIVDNATWARFDAKFVRVEPDGQVIFSVRDQGDRSIEEVRLTPAEGQVAYIDNRATPFRQLKTTDAISLYVPEGEYGFATRPGVPRAQLAVVAPVTTAPAPAPATRAPAGSTTVAPTPMVAQSSDTRSARIASTPAVLPQTAGPLPWLALGGLLSMLGGLGLTMRRRS
jgi:hypothetical protein